MAEINESTMKFNIDITDFRTGMKQAREALSDVNREFKVATAGMDKWSASTDGVQAKINQLNDQTEIYRKQLILLNNALEEAKTKFGENSFEAEKYKDKVTDTTVKLKNAEAQTAKYTKILTEMTTEQTKSVSAYDALNAEIAEQEAKVDALRNAYKSSIVGNNPEEAARLAEELKDATTELNALKQKMADADSATKALERSVTDLGDAEADTVSEHKALSLAIEDQQKKVDDLKEEYASAVIQYGKTSSEAQELAKQLKVASGELADMKNRMSDADKAADELDDSIEKAAVTAQKSANGGFTVLKGALANLVSSGIHRVIDGMKNLAKSAVEYEQEIEGYQIGFEVMTGSAQKAGEIVTRLGEIVKRTPFDMPTLADTTTLLMNYGLTADEAVDKMMLLGDISQGNADKLGRVALAYGQMSSAGKVHLQDIKQMIEAGFNPLQEISEKTGESMESLYNRISKGTISVDEIKAAFVRATSAGGKYYQSMDKQSQSFKGRLEALQEQINATLGKTFQPLLQKLSDRLLPRFTKLLEQIDTTKMAKGMSEFGEKVIQAFDWIVDNGDKVLEVLHGIAVAFVTYKAVSIVSNVVGAFSTLFSTIKAGQGIMTALNAAFGATPIGLLATGISGLVAVMAVLAKRNKEAIEAQYGLNSEQQKAIDKVAELARTYNDLNKARNDQMTDINAEFGYIRELKDEYNSYVDANGKVKDIYEDRANFILNELATAMGMEVKQVKELIEQNGKLGDSIDEVIHKKQAEAMLSANEQMYNEAIKNRASALAELTDAQKVLEEAEKKATETQTELQDVWKEYNKLLKDAPSAAESYLKANWSIVLSNDEAQKSYEEAKQKVEDAEGAWIGYNNTIQNYEGLAEAIISGDAKKINSAMTNMAYNFITAENSNRESLERQVENYKTNLDALEKAIEDGTPYVTQEMVEQAKSMVTAAEKELDKLPPEASAKGDKAGKNFAESIGSKKLLTEQNAKGLVDTAEISINPAIDKLAKAGAESGAEFADSIGSKENKDNAKAEAEGLADKATEGASSENGEQGGAKKSGSNFGKGFWEGIGSWFTSVWERGKELAKKALGGVKEGQEEGSPSKLTRQSGNYFGEGYELGILDMIKPVTEAASTLAKEAADALGTHLADEMHAIGAEGGKSLIDGMNTMMPDMSASIGDLKANVASANAMMSDTSALNVGSFGSQTTKTQNVVFNQTINSPKAVDRLTLYRETNSLLFSAKVRLNNV